MKPIEFDIWEPVPGEPNKVHRTGQRAAQEVFAELKHRLESSGLLPDEYFLMDRSWQDGVPIPEDAGLFCTADYGGSEGIYLDVYLKWHENDKAITRSFITGKTLDESGIALDRMHLVASAIMKAVHGQRDAAPDLRLRAQGEGVGTILHLSPAEHRLVIDSLIQRRESLKEDFSQTEQLLRRATGGILEYVSEIGERPLKISAYDQAVLAIHDGDYEAFVQGFKGIAVEQEGALLIHAAGRPGAVGRRMTQYLVVESVGIESEEYITASLKAVDTGDPERVSLMMRQAEHCVPGLDPTIYGEVIRHAYVESQRHIAKALIQQCSPEQITAANPTLLYIAAMNGDFHTCTALVEKGLGGGEHTDRIVHTLTHINNSWILERMVEKGFQLEAPAPQTLDEPQMGGMA